MDIAKKTLALLIFIAVIVSLLFNIFLGGYISAKLSQIPWLSKYNIVKQQAPIVINRKETVVADDGTDILDAVNSAKQRLAAVVAIEGGQMIRTGNALNITSEGSFVTTLPAFTKTGITYAVILVDGRIAPITEQKIDPATGLVFFKATATNIPVVNFAVSKEVVVGQRVVSVEQTTRSFTPNAYPAFVTSSQNYSAESIFEASSYTRTFTVQQIGATVAGGAVVNLSGDVLGLWNGNRIISSDVIKSSVNLYLSDKLERPAFGFAYEVISASKSKLLGIAEGARVARVVNNSSADEAGLVAGDIITAVGDKQLNDEVEFEGLLENIAPGKLVPFTVIRGQQTLILNISPAVLQ